MMKQGKIVVFLVFLGGCVALPTSPPLPSVASLATKVTTDIVTPSATSQVTGLPPRNNISPSTSATPILLPLGIVDTTKYKPSQSLVSNTGVQTVVAVPAGQVNSNKKPNINVGTMVGTQPEHHSAMTLPAKIEDPEILNAQPGYVNPIKNTNVALNTKPALHTPVTLPAKLPSNADINAPQNIKSSLVDPIVKPVVSVPQNSDKISTAHAVLPASIMTSKDNLNMAQNEKPAIQTPVLLPHGQADPNKRPTSVSTQPINTPMTLPAIVAPNDKPSLVDPIKKPIGENIANRPALHTPMTLPAQISSGIQNMQVKPAIHTPTTLPAQIIKTKDNLKMDQNEKLMVQTPVHLPLGQVDPNKKPLSVSTQPIHTPMTLPAQINTQIDSGDKIKPSENAKPAVLILSETNNDKKDVKVTVSEIKPTINNPVTLLPHISGEKKTDATVVQRPQILPGNSDKRGEVAESKKTVSETQENNDKNASTSLATSLEISASTNVNIGGSAQPARIKRQFNHRPVTLPARVPAGGFQNNGYGSSNGGYQGIQPIPAIYNRPAGGHYRG